MIKQRTLRPAGTRRFNLAKISRMGRSFAVCALLLLGVDAQSYAEENLQAQPMVSKKVDNGCFASTAVITDDKDWREKWETPRENTPSFQFVNKLDLGDEATLLWFYNCAALVDGEFKLECDVKITKPDGEVVVQQGAITCHEGPRKEDDMDVYLIPIQVNMKHTIDDGIGLMRVDLGVTDRNLGERISLDLSIEITGKEAE